ncbi:uncharacterized protein LOC126740692 [Anthonomus grandis grandis]|uniref:uncharacterized protein LOC126740692 n=1 Tax=Anthonomus grandis grandis TaxID=2921223 RepID=UPI0021653534|nr:uncharacterized protein LOC126740692 [Anthonomus grandis grandis]
MDNEIPGPSGPKKLRSDWERRRPLKYDELLQYANDSESEEEPFINSGSEYEPSSSDESSGPDEENFQLPASPAPVQSDDNLPTIGGNAAHPIYLTHTLHRNTAHGLRREGVMSVPPSAIIAVCFRSRKSEVRLFLFGSFHLIFSSEFLANMPRKRERTTAKAAWTEEDLLHARTAIERGMSKRLAARTYKIPFTTLRDRLKNQNIGRPRLGRKPVFNQQQESEIAEQVKLLGSIYYGLSVTDLRKSVYKYAEINSIKNNFDKNSKMAGLDWVQGFMRRNPSVAVRKAEATSLNRVSAFNKEEITHFYQMLGDLMEKYRFPPNNIYNADETGITTVTDPGKVLAEKGQRRVGAVTSGERGRNISVMCAMSAAGNFVPPMFIFLRQRMTPLLEKDGPPGAFYTHSKNGWINEELFNDFSWAKDKKFGPTKHEGRSDE